MAAVSAVATPTAGHIRRRAPPIVEAVVHMYRQDPRAVGTAADALARAIGEDRRWLAAYPSGQIAIMHAYAGEAEAAAPYLDRQGRLVGKLDNHSTALWWLYCQAEVSGETTPGETVPPRPQGDRSGGGSAERAAREPVAVLLHAAPAGAPAPSPCW